MKVSHRHIWRLDILFFLSISTLLVMVATILDIGFLDFYPLELIEEVLENAGLALCP